MPTRHQCLTVWSSNSHDLMTTSIPKIPLSLHWAASANSCTLINRWICWRFVKLPNETDSLSKPRTKTKAAARWVGAKSLVKLLKEIVKLSKLWHSNNSMCCSSYQRTLDDSPNSGTQTAPCVGGLSCYLNTLADSKNTLALRQPHVWDFSQVTELPCVHMWGFSSHQWTLAASPLLFRCRCVGGQIAQGFWQPLQTKGLAPMSFEVLKVHQVTKNSSNFSKHSQLDRLMCWRFIMSLIQLDVLEVRQVARRFWQPLHTAQCVGGSSSCKEILATSSNPCTKTARTQIDQCVGGSSSYQQNM